MNTATADAGEHQWFYYERLLCYACRKCGRLKRIDGKNSPCPGQVHVGLRQPPKAQS